MQYEVYQLLYKKEHELIQDDQVKVLEYFQDKKGINPKNLEASGRGSVDPIADNKTQKGRSKNRRVEIKIYGASGGN